MDQRDSSTEAPGDLRSSMGALLPSLEGRALRLTRSRPEAEDLVQETLIRALRFEATFQPGTNLRAWMNQILHSVFISRCRRRVRERRAMQRFVCDPTLTATAAAAPMLSAVSNRMHSALYSLPDKFRTVVELVDLRDHSYREAAEIMGVPVGTVMSRLFRARKMLGSALGESRRHRYGGLNGSGSFDGARRHSVKTARVVSDEERAVFVDAGTDAVRAAHGDAFAEERVEFTELVHQRRRDRRPRTRVESESRSLPEIRRAPLPGSVTDRRGARGTLRWRRCLPGDVACAH